MYQAELLHIVYLPQGERLWNVSAKSIGMFLRTRKNLETQCFCFPDQTHFTTWSCFSWKWLWLLSSVLWACARHAKLLLAASSPTGLGHGAAQLTKQQKEAITFRQAGEPPRTEASVGMFCIGCSAACRLCPRRRAISHKLVWQLQGSILPEVEI